MLVRVEESSAPDGLSSDLPIRFAGVSYGVGAVSILRDIDLELTAGPPTMLLGPNGSGKSTLLKLAMGLIAPTSGAITFAGRRMGSPGRRAIVFQKPVMLRRTATANVAYALRVAGKPAGKAEMIRLLEEVGLGALGDRPARRLSGGQRRSPGGPPC